MCAFFSPEILQVGAVKGLKSPVFCFVFVCFFKRFVCLDLVSERLQSTLFQIKQ